MEARIFIFECVTNMHVGNGDVNYGIVDNEIERDVVTQLPTINPSSVKGALREFYEKQVVKSGYSDTCVSQECENCRIIFGTKDTGQQPGKFRFLSGDLLAQPRQATEGTKPYELVSPEAALQQLNQRLELFVGKKVLENDLLTELANLVGVKNIQKISKENYESLSLPVIARNQLKDGISENLWYEEVLPHKSLLALTIVDDSGEAGVFDGFEAALESNLVQFGANASIGYGICRLVKVYKKEENGNG